MIVEEERGKYSAVFPYSHTKEELEDSKIILPLDYGDCRSRKHKILSLTLAYFRETIKSI